MQAPVLVLLGHWLSRQQGREAVRAPQPWFAYGFILIVIPSSLMTMAALGLSSHLSELKPVGWKPMMLGSILFLHLVVTGLIVTLLATTWL